MLNDYRCPCCARETFDLSAMMCENCGTIFDSSRYNTMKEYMKGHSDDCRKYIKLRTYDMEELTPRELLLANKSLAFVMASM